MRMSNERGVVKIKREHERGTRGRADYHVLRSARTCMLHTHTANRITNSNVLSILKVINNERFLTNGKAFHTNGMQTVT